MERFKGFTDSQVSDFWRAATKAGFQSGPWYEARRYSGPSVTVHYELSFKRGWFSKSQVAVGEDCEAMQNIADCIADTPQYCDGSLSVQMGHWEIHSGHFAVVKKYVFRGGSRDVIISVLAPAGVGEAAIDAELGKENEKVVGYVLSSKADDVQTLVKSMEARLLRPIPPDLHVALMERVKEVCNARPYDEAGFARMVHQVVLRHVGCNGIHTSQLVSEYLELPVTFEPMWRSLPRGHVNMMFDAVAASSMKEHDKAEADFALISLLDGAFPTPDRICLLRGVWPEELVQKYLNARERNLAAKAAHERLQQSGENSETNVDSRNPIASP